MIEIADARATTAFEDLYRRDFGAVVALAFGLSGSRAVAEELAQDAFLAAHRDWARVGGYENPGAWVRRVAVNRAVSGLRRRAAEARAMSRFSGRRPPEPALPDTDEEFWRAVRKLPARQAQAVALFYVEDRSLAEIAAVLDIAEGTVKVHLHRGRQALAAGLGCTIEEEQ